MSEARGPDVIPRPASTLVLVRGDATPEVLLLLRHGQHGFMPNMWVYPGGRVEADDGEGEAGARRAALRETHEEAGIALGEAATLWCFARWVTPVGEKRRFDTRFYLARVADVEAFPDRGEVIDALWIGAAEGIVRHREGKLALAPPTLWVLEVLKRLATIDAIGAWAAEQERAGVPAVEPKLTLEGGTVVVAVEPSLLRLPPGEDVSGRLKLVRGVWEPS